MLIKIVQPIPTILNHLLYLGVPLGALPSALDTAAVVKTVDVPVDSDPGQPFLNFTILPSIFLQVANDQIAGHHNS